MHSVISDAASYSQLLLWHQKREDSALAAYTLQ
jgi:hypothetical protein